MWIRSTMGLLAVAAVAAGCQSVEGAIKENGGKAKSALAKIAPLAADMRTRAPVKQDQVAPLDAPLVFDTAYPRTANAALVYYEDLVALGEVGSVYARIRGTKQISECASLLEHRTFPWDPKESGRWTEPVAGFEVEKKLEVCGQLKTLFVLRTMELVKPSNARVEMRFDGGPGVGTLGIVSTPSESACRVLDTQCRFDGGQVKAEVHVFALEPFAYKGAFLLDVENTAKVRLSSVRTDDTLELDLAEQVAAAFVAATLKNIPGATVKGLP
jgi:hypothetical protein